MTQGGLSWRVAERLTFEGVIIAEVSFSQRARHRGETCFRGLVKEWFVADGLVVDSQRGLVTEEGFVTEGLVKEEFVAVWVCYRGSLF